MLINYMVRIYQLNLIVESQINLLIDLNKESKELSVVAKHLHLWLMKMILNPLLPRQEKECMKS